MSNSNRYALECPSTYSAVVTASVLSRAVRRGGRFAPPPPQKKLAIPPLIYLKDNRKVILMASCVVLNLQHERC